ncbi:hypothetical protein BDP27DRAFT_1548405 [Rhodocollybia butyracea]|uniref:Uncharacterized protein n=1 Tax=Rhodocollybia butyracea TaxID=206335 RepID=A0A9P5PMH6_9AGAR|nr:hypothetical protein BDP27DRAFT_1548405 [Rhodocollybia butyracea]
MFPKSFISYELHASEIPRRPFPTEPYDLPPQYSCCDGLIHHDCAGWPQRTPQPTSDHPEDYSRKHVGVDFPTTHHLACFKIHGVETSFILQHTGVFEAVRGKVKCSLCSIQDTVTACTRPEDSLTCSLCHKCKKQCNFFTLLRFCAYTKLEGIHVLEAVTRLCGAPKILNFPSELYKKALKALEARNSCPSELVFFPRLMKMQGDYCQVAKDKAEDPSHHDDGVKKKRKHHKKTKKMKDHGRSRPLPIPQANDQHSPLRVLIPALSRATIPTPPAPMPSSEPVPPIHVPDPSSTTDTLARMKQPAPVDPDSSCHERAGLSNVPIVRNGISCENNLAEMTSCSTGFEAEAHNFLAVQLKESALSSAIVRKEFLKSRERTKQLEKQLSQRPRIETDFKDILHLEEENRRLRVSENSLRE